MRRRIHCGKRCGSSHCLSRQAQPNVYAILKKILDVPRLESHLYGEDEYRSLKGTLDRMSASGLVLFPAEDTGGDCGQKQGLSYIAIGVTVGEGI